MERIRTSAPVTQPNDLANRPLQPLEYHSVYGRGSKNRTHNLRFWRPLLYQLSYTPVIWGDRWGSNPRMLEPQSSVLTTSPRPPYCNRQLPILPGRLQPSTFGVYVLNYCVRNGNRWVHIAIITGYSSLSFSSIALSFVIPRSEEKILRYSFENTYVPPKLYRNIDIILVSAF